MASLAEEDRLTQKQQDFFDSFWSLTPAKQDRVLELLALARKAREAFDEEERSANLVVASKLLYGRPKVRTEPLRISRDGRQKLQKHRDHVAANIKKLREKAGLTQQQLAEAAGLQQNHVSRLETAHHAATYKTIQKIANALGVSPSKIDTSFE